MLEEKKLKLNKARDTIYNYDGPLEGFITIPNVLKGYKISKIKNGAFAGKRITNLIIEEGYEEIEDNAFFGNPLEKIHLPSTLKKIGYQSLKAIFRENRAKFSEIIYLGDWNLLIEKWEYFGLDPRSLPNYKFENECGFLGSKLVYINEVPDVPALLNIPSHIKVIKHSIAKRSFYNRSTGPIRSLKLPSSLIEIEDFAFDKNELKEIILPSTTKKIGRNAFSENQLKYVQLNDGLRSIDEAAFSENSIEHIEIPTQIDYLSGFDRNSIRKLVIKGAREIGFYAFYENLISELKLNEGTEIIGISAFRKNRITKIFLPDTLKKISSGSFSDNQIENIHFGSQLKEIGPDAFEANKLKEINLPNTVEYIGHEAFATNNLEELKLPSHLKQIGDGAFRSNQIREISWNQALEYIGQDKHVDQGEGVFSKNLLTHLEIPDLVKYIGKYAFSENMIKSVTFGDSLEFIEEAAFIDNKIHRIEFNKGLRTISRWAFMNNKIEVVELFDGLETIEARAFMNNQISSVVIPASVTKIGNDAFKSQNRCLKRVIILGKETRFNKNWEKIGFPKRLMPRK